MPATGKEKGMLAEAEGIGEKEVQDVMAIVQSAKGVEGTEKDMIIDTGKGKINIADIEKLVGASQAAEEAESEVTKKEEKEETEEKSVADDLGDFNIDLSKGVPLPANLKVQLTSDENTDVVEINEFWNGLNDAQKKGIFAKLKIETAEGLIKEKQKRFSLFTVKEFIEQIKTCY